MRKWMVIAGAVLLAGVCVAGCFVGLTPEEKAELLEAKEKFEAATDRLESVTDDLDRLKAEGDRLQARFDSGELSLSDFMRANAELKLFLESVETKWKDAKTDFDSAKEGFSAVQKQIKERSGSGAGAWIQSILGGFGLEIPAGAIAILEYLRRKRRERQVGLLSRAGAKTRGEKGIDFGAALKAEMTPADRNGLRAVEKAAENGTI